MADYRHPASGRIYREGDPAHDFARLARHLRDQCERFIDQYDRRLADRDYLGQYQTWSSDPDRLRRTIQDTCEAIDKAYTRVTVDWHAPLIDFGDPEARAEHERRYGPIEEER